MIRFVLVMVPLLGACAASENPPLVIGNDCYVAGGPGIPSSLDHCEGQAERVEHFATAFTALCDEADPDNQNCEINKKLHGYGVDYGPTPIPDGPD